jgi:hypothetical protein
MALFEEHNLDQRVDLSVTDQWVVDIDARIEQLDEREQGNTQMVFVGEGFTNTLLSRTIVSAVQELGVHGLDAQQDGSGKVLVIGGQAIECGKPLRDFAPRLVLGRAFCGSRPAYWSRLAAGGLRLFP